jgi:hypothetical protein
MTGFADLTARAGNTGKAAETGINNGYMPEKSFYSGSEKLISAAALQDLAEHLSSYRCMDYVRKAFAEVLDGLDMPGGDRAYYKWIAGIEE